MTTTDIDWPALLERAIEAQNRAYAPYSRFFVGAALLSAEGRIFCGANVENASYGAAICAERVAVCTAVTAGHRRFSAAVIVSSAQTPTPPCGICRQFLVEFPPAFPVRSYGQDGRMLELTTAELLPHAFGAASMAQPEPGRE